MAQANETQKPEPEIYMPDYRSEAEITPRWIRAQFGGETIADSKKALLFREVGYLPVYYFPQEDVRTDLLEVSDYKTESPHKGEAAHWTINVADQVSENAAWSYLDPPVEQASIKGHIAFYWNKMDAWHEEEEEVFVHPRDPYKRIDVMPSSRHVQVVVGGETVADSRQPRLLFETWLPTRYYIPKEDVRMELLERTEAHSRCPYKGIADYWAVRVGDQVFKNIAWGYHDPIPECPKVKDLVCFFNEKVDAIYVDGELLPVPVTPWSK